MGADNSAITRPRATLLAVAFAMVLPTLLSWVYFVGLAGGHANLLQRLVYVLGKVVQFGFPAAFAILVEKQWPRPTWPRRQGLGLGLGFGLLVAVAMLALYALGLRDSPALSRTPEMVRNKLNEFGVGSPVAFVLLGAFISLGHSLFEEYYYRWFIFGRLRRLVPWVPALFLSSLAFMAHHVIVLSVYLPGYFLAAVVPFSLAIAVGGAFWAFLYEWTGALYASWVSHALVDAAIFTLGWDLMHRLPVGAP